MHLFDEPFELISKGKKDVEIRLNDEKRRKIKVGDTIIFKRLSESGEELRCKVVNLTFFKTFRELLESVDPSNLKEGLRELNRMYNENEEKLYGVLAIQIAMIRSDC